MQVLNASSERQGTLRHVADWWRNWKNRRAAIDELRRCGEDEAAHIARDVGISPSELRTLAGKWPDSTDLLSERIVAVGLDAENIRETEPLVLRDLQRVCTQCAAHSRCKHELEQDQHDEQWRDYCPNVATLDALRTEDRDRRWLRRRKWRLAESTPPPCC